MEHNFNLAAKLEVYYASMLYQPHVLIHIIYASPFVRMEHDNTIGKCNGEHSTRLGVIWDSVQLQTSLHQHHAQGRLTAGEALLMLVVEKVDSVRCL